MESDETSDGPSSAPFVFPEPGTAPTAGSVYPGRKLGPAAVNSSDDPSVSDYEILRARQP